MNCDRIVCPSCDGEGESMAHVHMGHKGSEWRMVPCFRCGGEKYISREQAAWIAEGKRLQQRRREQNRSQEEEAALLGLTPQELSLMELGRAMPYTMRQEETTP